MKKTIEVIVSPAGEIQIDAVGFKGADCEAATRFLEEALGVVGKKVKKARIPPTHHFNPAAEDWRIRRGVAGVKLACVSRVDLDTDAGFALVSCNDASAKRSGNWQTMGTNTIFPSPLLEPFIKLDRRWSVCFEAKAVHARRK